jgi:hypothetical protein
VLEADNFVDFLEDWIWATVGMIESEASADPTASRAGLRELSCEDRAGREAAGEG